MENYFDYKYRLYFRTYLTSFSQCKDVVYTNKIEDIHNALDNITGYNEYLFIINTENGPITERGPLERPMSKILKH